MRESVSKNGSITVVYQEEKEFKSSDNRAQEREKAASATEKKLFIVGWNI